jgi:hypothetical protein
LPSVGWRPEQVVMTLMGMVLLEAIRFVVLRLAAGWN